MSDPWSRARDDGLYGHGGTSQDYALHGTQAEYEAFNSGRRQRDAEAKRRADDLDNAFESLQTNSTTASFSGGSSGMTASFSLWVFSCLAIIIIGGGFWIQNNNAAKKDENNRVAQINRAFNSSLSQCPSTQRPGGFPTCDSPYSRAYVCQGFVRMTSRVPEVIGVRTVKQTMANASNRTVECEASFKLESDNKIHKLLFSFELTNGRGSATQWKIVP